ncbi:hypothetical protein BO86DRAFT_392784 [Aspergillus japonicus CBS 114.51]|uniref:Uncharacterized protein n=1 Tax=Aspergillus japonicus CBS 114.51 TaxID=1448312 RepID=A0A8T8WNX4_ASPJA|nr:hypothetical protein BO86DRAFT_392784 [Aspergillus japonicus CBS 114.51]RAH77330.1 hypothetical protein BO86DRAFT_392784 [Aspergillus japonicus CBS 114.51]
MVLLRHLPSRSLILGLGIGLGLQSAIAPSQTVPLLFDVAFGTSIIMFLEDIGGALMESVVNVFTN